MPSGSRIPNAAHESRPWRIRAIVPDFELEDVWALPVEGRADEFPALLDVGTAFEPVSAASLPTRLLWGLREQLGRVLDRGIGEASIADRLPEDLRGTADGVRFGSLPFVPLFRTDDEFAAELSNATVHAVMHLAWAEVGNGRYQGQMAVYVKPRGRLGRTYMALIKPFRLWIVYPALMRQMERAWSSRPAASAAD